MSILTDGSSWKQLTQARKKIIIFVKSFMLEYMFKTCPHLELISKLEYSILKKLMVRDVENYKIMLFIPKLVDERNNTIKEKH